MPHWTDLATLKSHVQAFNLDSIAVREHPAVLSGTAELQLPHNTLDEDSIRVYSLQRKTPYGPMEHQFSADEWWSTGQGPLLPGSVVISDDTWCTNRYTEGSDYVVDSENGSIKKRTGGSLPITYPLQIWLVPLKQYTVDEDFTLDASLGRIARKSSGIMPDPVRVMISYTTQGGGLVDSQLSAAIEDAETKITARLREEYSTSTVDDALTLGATELALALLCDDMALGNLIARVDSAADDRAQKLMQLASRYELRALGTLSPFIKLPAPSPVKRQANPAPLHSW